MTLIKFFYLAMEFVNTLFPVSSDAQSISSVNVQIKAPGSSYLTVQKKIDYKL